MSTTIRGLLRLARYKEYLCFVVITTLFGASAAEGYFGWRLVGVLVANWLAVAFAFMINDVEDAPDDALNPAKVMRNPVSARHLSRRLAYGASIIVAVLAAVTFLPLGLNPFLAGLASLVLSFLYSWRKIRLKTIPVLDMVSHCLMLSGLQFLTAYYTFHPSSLERWLFPFLFLVAISVYGSLFNQLRDFEYDMQAGVRDTASLLGPRPAYWLMMIALGVGVASGLVTVFVIRLIPAWVLLLLVGLAAIMVMAPVLKAREKRSAIAFQQSFQKPLEIAAALALAVQFVGPWALGYLVAM